MSTLEILGYEIFYEFEIALQPLVGWGFLHGQIGMLQRFLIDLEIPGSYAEQIMRLPAPGFWCAGVVHGVPSDGQGFLGIVIAILPVCSFVVVLC